MKYSQNWANKTIWTGDNLHIMRGMNSDSIDLIYLDPPFNSNTNYAAPIGSKAAGAEFKDTWNLTDIDIAWLDLLEAKHPQLNRVIQATMTDSDKSYMVYIAVRLLEMKRLLKPTGSIYLHCDPTMSHYLKLAMDAIFGKKNFRNEIVWHYSGWNKKLKAHLERRHDLILFYAKSSKQSINYPTRPWLNKDEYIKVRKQKVRYDKDGRDYVLSDGGAGKRVKRYLDEAMMYGVPLDNVWNIPKLNNSDNEHSGYKTQKPLALLSRIIEASSNRNDVVLDPFCGCATTCVMSERLKREWVGIDISEKAAGLVRDRIDDLYANIINRSDIPQRTDLGKIPKYNSTANKTKLYGNQGGFCNGCHEHFQSQNLEIDHIISRKQGGTDHIDNLQLLCGHCNRVKGDRGMEYLKAKFQF